MSAEPETKINDVIIKLYEVRQLRCYLERQEQEYQLQLNQFLDKNNIEAIKGPSLQLTRKTTTRLRMSKYNLPKEIYEQYAQERLRMSITKKDLPEEIYKKYAQEKRTSVLIIDPGTESSISAIPSNETRKEAFQRRLKRNESNDNKGAIWTGIEDENLLIELDENKTINEIAKMHGRSDRAIKARINRIARQEIDAGESIDIVMNMVKMTKDEIQDIIYRHGKYLQTHKGTHK